MKVTVQWGSGENPLSRLARWLPPVSMSGVERSLVLCLCLEGHGSHRGGPILMTSSQPDHLPEAPPPVAVILGVRASA